MDNGTEIKALPVIINQAARNQLRHLRQLLNVENDLFLRIGIKQGGCAGSAFLLAFDNQEPNDQVFPDGEFPVVINKAHLMYVAGMEIDWIQDGGDQGFVFLSPADKN